MGRAAFSPGDDRRPFRAAAEAAAADKVHIIHMRRIPEEALREMDSNLKYVLGIMRHTKSSKRYEAYICENREYFSRIPKSALDVIDVCTNIKDIRKHLEFVTNEENSEEEADMCYALEQLQRNAEKKGIRQGIKQGVQQGIKQGVQQGIKQGVQQGIKQGVQQGIKQGVQQMNELVRRLLADGRQEDLLRATADAGYRRKLLAEYKI